MDAPNNIVLMSQYNTVSPRSPISSEKYNDFVEQTAADLINIKTQLNRFLIGLDAGTDTAEVWTSGQGLDGKGIYFDSKAASPESIYDHVTILDNTVTALSTQVNSLSASNVSYEVPNAWIGQVENNVKATLDRIINIELPLISGINGLTINTSNLNIDSGLTMNSAGDLWTIGSSAIPWNAGHFVNMDIDGTLSFNGVAFDPNAAAGSNASDVNYNPSTMPNYQTAITNVEQALDALGNLDLAQVFPKAGQPIKRIPTVGDVVGTAGNTVAQWLQALFFPFLQGTSSIAFQNYSIAEVGQDLTDVQMRSNIVIDDADSITSSYIRYGAYGADFNNPSEYTEQAVTITIPTNADDPKTIETIHSISGTISDNTRFTLYVEFDNEGSAITKMDTANLFFHNRVMWIQRSPAFTPTITEFWNAAQSQGNQLPVNSQPPASITVTPSGEDIFIAIPVRYGKYITAIGDPNISGATGALGSWEICTGLPATAGGAIPTTATLAADNSVIVPNTSGYHTQLNGIADLSLYDFIIYKTVSPLDSSGVAVTFNFTYGSF